MERHLKCMILPELECLFYGSNLKLWIAPLTVLWVKQRKKIQLIAYKIWYDTDYCYLQLRN